MNKKIFCFFLFFFFLVFSMGCIGNGEDRRKEDELIRDGLSTRVLVNGIETNKINLISGQSAEIGLNIRNAGENPIENVNVRLIGWLKDLDKSDISNEADEIIPGAEHYLNWRVTAPELSRGEKINHPAFLRMCFDYTTESYSDIIIIPEDYGTPPASFQTTSSDYLNVLYNIGATRVIKGRDNTIVGQLIIRNKGSGWVDYPLYTQDSNLQRNLLRKIEIRIEGLEDAKIISYGAMKEEEIEDFVTIERIYSEKDVPVREYTGERERIQQDIIDDDDMIPMFSNVESEEYNFFDELSFQREEDVVREYIVLTIDEQNIDKTSDLYLLRLIRGIELINRIEIKLPDSEKYQEGLIVGGMHVTVEHGYCIDIATLDVSLSG